MCCNCLQQQKLALPQLSCHQLRKAIRPHTNLQYPVYSTVGHSTTHTRCIFAICKLPQAALALTRRSFGKIRNTQCAELMANEKHRSASTQCEHTVEMSWASYVNCVKIQLTAGKYSPATHYTYLLLTSPTILPYTQLQD